MEQRAADHQNVDQQQAVIDTSKQHFQGEGEVVSNTEESETKAGNVQEEGGRQGEVDSCESKVSRSNQNSNGSDEYEKAKEEREVIFVRLLLLRVFLFLLL